MRAGEVSLFRCALQCFFGFLLRCKCRGFVELFAPECGICKNRHEVRLNLEHTARDIEKVFFAFRVFDADFTGFQSGKERSMARRYADLTHARRRIDHRGVT